MKNSARQAFSPLQLIYFNEYIRSDTFTIILNFQKMKSKILIISLFIILVAGAFYGFNYLSAGYPDEYCAEMKDGILTVMHLGNPITSEVTLDDGSKIQPNGIIITNDGTQMILKPGECIDRAGKIMEGNPE